MMQQHSGSGKAHDRSNLFPHFRLVAMDSAVGAKGFGFHKGTSLTALNGVFLQCRTAWAKFIMFRAVLLFAIQTDHQGYRLLFPFSFGGCVAHTFYLLPHGKFGRQLP